MAVTKNLVNIGDAQVTGDLIIGGKIVKTNGGLNQALMADGSVKNVRNTMNPPWFDAIPYIKNDGVMEVGKYIDFHASNTETTDNDFRFTATSGVLTGSGTLAANRMESKTGFFQTSDITKKNVLGELDLDKAYDLINKCQTIIYSLKDDESNKEQIGLIAQEVKEFFPEIISECEDGTLSLDYSRLTVVILKVLKDLIKRVSKLEEKTEKED